MGKIHDAMMRSAQMQNEIRDAAWLERHEDAPLRLYISGLGKCPRAQWLGARAHLDDGVKQTNPPGEFLIKLFRCGIELENATVHDLRFIYDKKVGQDVRVDDGVFAGRMDIPIAKCEDWPDGVIVEHKATGQYNFNYGPKRTLPLLDHAYQVLMYQRLHHKETGRWVPAMLYYRGWTSYAEFNLETQDDSGIWYFGDIKGHEVNGCFEGKTLDKAIAEIEPYWSAQKEPPKYDHPFTVGKCVAKNYSKKDSYWPRCGWFGYCWPEYGELPIEDDRAPW